MEGTPYRWLDFRAFATRILDRRAEEIGDDVEIDLIRYFTARVDDRRQDGAPDRQAAYWRALRAHDEKVEIIEGQFRSDVRRQLLAQNGQSVDVVSETHPQRFENREIAPHRQFVDVIRSEEKGTDVNIGSYLLVDGFDDHYDLALVISNDSDLVSPIAIVRERLGRTVMLAPPLYLRQRGRPRMPSVQLERVCDFTVNISKGMRRDLRECQLPAELSDSNGTVRRPARWDPPPEWDT